MAGELQRIRRLALHSPKLTTSIRSWLASHPEGVVIETPEDAALVVRLLRRATESRSGAFHPSGLSDCPRAQCYAYHGAPRVGNGAQLQAIFNDGNWRHARWQLMLMKTGMLDDVEVPVRIETKRLTGSMDGVGTDEDGTRWFFELKGTSASVAAMTEPSPVHRLQVQAYLLASGLDHAVMVYESKTSQDFVEFKVERDPATMDEIEDLLEYLNHHIEEETMPPQLASCKAKEDSYHDCPFRHTCIG